MEENFEMPTPCQHCGEIFDLNDGYGSEKWYPDIVICETCYREEEAEIDEDDRWETINIDVSNALYEVEQENGWGKLTEENRESISNIINGNIWIDKNKRMPGKHPEYKDCTKTVIVTDGKNWGHGHYNYTTKNWTYYLVGFAEKDDNNVTYWSEPPVLPDEY